LGLSTVVECNAEFLLELSLKNKTWHTRRCKPRTKKGIGSEERLRNDLFCIEWNVKP